MMLSYMNKPRNVKYGLYECIGCACYLRHADILLGLFFDYVDGNDIFLRKVVACQRITRHFIQKPKTLN
jgi:hypothetical protein